MGDKSSVKVTFLGDATALAAAARKARGQIDSVGRQADKSSGLMGGAFGKMGASAKAGVAGLVGGSMVAAGAKVFDMAANMQLMDAKAKTVFGNQIGVVRKWAKANASAMGLTSREATTLSANFADLLIPMGFTRDAAAKMSTKVVGLSGALAQWSGGTKTAAEVSQILAKAMLGERDGLKELGISISDADVKARLLVMGKSKLTGAALQQATALATEQLIMEKSTDAQTAYAKGTSTLATKKAQLTAKIKELRDSALAALIPKLMELSDWLATKGVPTVERFVKGFRDGTGAGGSLASALGTVSSAAKLVGDLFMPIARWLAAHPTFFKSVAEGGMALAVALKLQALYGAMVSKLMPGLATSTAAQGAAAKSAAVSNAANARAMAAGRLAALGLGAAAIYAANKWAAAMNASIDAQAAAEDSGGKAEEMAAALRYANQHGYPQMNAWKTGGWGKRLAAAQATGDAHKVWEVVRAFKKTLPGYASGTLSAPPGLAMVGERGPELVNFRGGEQVYPSGTGPRGGGGGGSDRPLVVQFVMDGRVVQESLLRLKNITGGELGLA